MSTPATPHTALTSPLLYRNQSWFPDPALLMAGERAVALALEEDLLLGDITSEVSIPPTQISSAIIEARSHITIAGLFLADLVFSRLSMGFSSLSALSNAQPANAHPHSQAQAQGQAHNHCHQPVTITLGDPTIQDGATVEPGTVILGLQGPSRLLLAGERTLLNFLGRLCGVAGLTRAYTDTVAGTGSTTRILDTRKTTPGLRILEKYAVTCGGGFNHRTNLGDGILLKDNHIKACGGVTQAVLSAHQRARHIHKIEVEVTTMIELEEALAAGAQVVLLDNMTPEQVKAAVERCSGLAVTEVSGGVNLGNLTAYAAANPDYISVGALTHSAPCADLSMVFL